MRPDNAKRLVIRVVVLGGAAALVAAWASAPPVLDEPTVRRAVILLLIGIAAELVSIRIPRGQTSEQITLGEVAIAADVALLPLALAPVVAVAALTLSLLVRRRPLVKTAYNAGQYAIATFAAVTCFHGLGGGDIETSAGLVALFLGMAAFGASNLLTISTIISTTSGERLGGVLRSEIGLSLAITLGSSSVGIVAVALWLERPVLVGAILAPVLTLHLAYRGWIRQRDFVTEMADQKAKLERIVEHSSEGIALVDADGTVVLWSPSMGRLTGVAPAEAEGKSIGFLLRGRAPDGSSAQVEVDGEDSLMEVTRADGSTLWLRVRHGSALDPSGTVRWDVVLVHDVTAERETERMKKHFLATVSHELRTPLTPIIGFARFLLRRDEVPATTRRDALLSVVDRAEHMQRLVEDLLLASSMDEGDALTLHARREPVDVAEVVTRVVRSLKTSKPEREIVIEEREPVLAVGDRLRMSQVAANLLDNAVKYSAPDSTVRVVIDREGDRAVLAVIDEGRGIPSDRFEDIFRKFRRLEDPDRMETGGAGLGLFIVDQLVRAMAGTVEVSSRVGQGSSFTVRLPALDSASREDDTARPALAG
ncbi:MAG: PAS domain-containing sensor histidine kinase [Actinomycetota bacterium]